ncbi:MAG: hypothetical protein ICV83_35280 [Cytophagales bacterium]|nr:hypothetical protein [Cytophagales bacterium]
MKTFLNTTKKMLGALVLAVFAMGFASAQNQDTAPAPDTTRNASAGDTVGTANGNTPLDNTSTQGTKPTGRTIIHDRGTTSIGQYDPSGNTLPPERSPYEYIGAPSYNVDRKPKQKPTQRQYRDYGGTVFRQPDPSGTGTPATPMVKEDPYASNQPAAPNTTAGNALAPADSAYGTTSQPSLGNTGERRPATGSTNANRSADPAATAPANGTNGVRNGANNTPANANNPANANRPTTPAPKRTAPADTTKQQKIKGWDY